MARGIDGDPIGSDVGLDAAVEQAEEAIRASEQQAEADPAVTADGGMAAKRDSVGAPANGDAAAWRTWIDTNEPLLGDAVVMPRDPAIAALAAQVVDDLTVDTAELLLDSGVFGDTRGFEAEQNVRNHGEQWIQ